MPDIANGIRSPQVEDPLSAGLRLQRVRQLRLENKQRALQIEQQQRHLAAQRARPPQPPPTAQGAEIMTFGVLNGRAWRTSAEVIKTMYITGMEEALAMAAPEKLPEYCPAGLTLDEIRQAIDRFYGEPENSLVPSSNR